MTKEEPLLNASYHCSACGRTHNTSSKIGRQHRIWATQRDQVVHPTEDPRKVGGTYRSHYWRDEYRVLAREDRDGFTYFTVQWSDGRTTRHSTPWDRRDQIVSEP